MAATGMTWREDEARRKAWRLAMEGFKAALAVEGLTDEDRVPLVACYIGAAEISGRPRLDKTVINGEGDA